MSRLVPVLLYCLTGQARGRGSEEEEGEGQGSGVRPVVAATAAAAAAQEPVAGNSKARERVRLFKRMFAEVTDELPADLDSR